MENEMSKEPKNDFYRYAFGYSGKKPDVSFWIVLAGIAAVTAIGIAGLL